MVKKTIQQPKLLNLVKKILSTTTSHAITMTQHNQEEMLGIRAHKLKRGPASAMTKSKLSQLQHKHFQQKTTLWYSKKKLPLHVSCLLAHRQKMLLPIWTISINCLHTKILITRFQTRQSPSSTVQRT